MLVSHLICIFCSAPDFGLTTFFFLIYYLLCKTLRKIQDGNKELNVSRCDGFTQYIFLRTYYVPDTIGHVIVYKNIYCFSHFCVCVCVCAKIQHRTKFTVLTTFKCLVKWHLHSQCFVTISTISKTLIIPEILYSLNSNSPFSFPQPLVTPVMLSVSEFACYRYFI